MAEWTLNWEPETRFEYHATSAHWVLAEIINEVTGNDYREEIHQRVRALRAARHEYHVVAQPERVLARIGRRRQGVIQRGAEAAGALDREEDRARRRQQLRHAERLRQRSQRRAPLEVAHALKAVGAEWLEET